MAERVEPTSREPSAAEQAAEDLTVMFPDASLKIGAETIIVSEYPFMQWLKLKSAHQPFLEELAELVGHTDGGIEVDELMEFFENQFQHVKTLISASIDRQAEFFTTLKSNEMDTLILTWWGVNKHFFLRSVHRTLRKQNKVLLDGQTSSNP